MSERKYAVQRHPPRVVKPAVDLTVTRGDAFQSGERVREVGTAAQAVTLWSLDRQHAKAFRREHGGMSGRAFKRARKAGQRAAREAARQAAQAAQAKDAA